MAKPIILAVDDEPRVLNAVERDLRNHYRGDYRILKATSGREALTTVQQLKQRNSPLALFLVDQRMPEMSGTEFLGEALHHQHQPDRAGFLPDETLGPTGPESVPGAG
jgi:thioredoxin reductase (NADPH)